MFVMKKVILTTLCGSLLIAGSAVDADIKLNTTAASVVMVNKVANMLHQQAKDLSSAVIEKIIATLKCAAKNNIAHNNILSVIDYSLPSNQKRLWIFDLDKNKLLYESYVSHGLMSGALLSQYFSDKSNSKASSIGIYHTEKPYRGRHGLSLKLDGLDKNFNTNANARYIVMHGAWYVNETFIKKYGRAGRSWGCPAVPVALTEPIINTLQGNALLVAYYPDENWITKSKFLNCEIPIQTNNVIQPIKNSDQKIVYEKITFADLNNNNHHEENDPVVVISADNYTRIFKTAAPLERMLRRQINQVEYIVLSSDNLDKIVALNQPAILNAIYFVVPEIKMVSGYYGTEMKMINLGKVKEIKKEQPDIYALYVEGKTTPVAIKTAQKFIRWVGL